MNSVTCRRCLTETQAAREKEKLMLEPEDAINPAVLKIYAWTTDRTESVVA